MFKHSLVNCAVDVVTNTVINHVLHNFAYVRYSIHMKNKVVIRAWNIIEERNIINIRNW